MISKEKVTQLIEEVRPSLQADGGDIELVEILEDNTVRVRLKGACNGCPMAALTLKAGVERTLKKHLPEIKEVVAVD